jgi:cyclopropane fatty-acyl-phospholipid synthase-like methyltransferase
MGEDDLKKSVAMEKRETAADARQYSPSAARNREPILDVLRRILPNKGSVLEIGSGTGEHAVHFAKTLPGITWQPSDPDADSRVSIEAWVEAEKLDNVRPPIPIDVRFDPWIPEDRKTFDAVVSINMVHIAPWEATLGLFTGAARVLRASGILFLYGPFMRGGQHTAKSNAEFDASLKQRNPAWGLRDITALARLAENHRLTLREAVSMPANNFSLIFGRVSRPKLRSPLKVSDHMPMTSIKPGAPLQLD